MKTVLFFVGIFPAALLLNLPAFAQVQYYVSISWNAPTTAGKGTVPLTGANVLTGSKIYVSTSPLTTIPASPTFIAPAGQTSAAGNVPALPGQTLYVYVTACDSAGCSAFSPVGTKIVPAVAAIPDPPTGVTIAALVLATS